MSIDLKDLNRKQLNKLIKDAQAQIVKIEKQEIKEARKAAEDAVGAFGFSLAEVMGAKGGKSGVVRTKGAAKYANPADNTQTWTGKGRQPQWFKDAVAGGADPESMAV